VTLIQEGGGRGEGGWRWGGWGGIDSPSISYSSELKENGCECLYI